MTMLSNQDRIQTNDTGAVRAAVGGILAIAALLSSTALAPAPAGAQVPDALLPWVGCWNGTAQEAGTTVCFVPTEDGLDRRTFRESEHIETAHLSLRQPGEVSAEGCAGTVAVDRSADGRRLFTETELVCGQEMERATTGLMAMLTETSWLEVTAATIAGENAAWTTSYELASPTLTQALLDADPADGISAAVASARSRAAYPRMAIDAVIETHHRLGARGTEAWIAERDLPLTLDADALVRLADAGVAPRVIDMAVAVSFREHFEVAKADRYDDRFRRGMGYDMPSPLWWRGRFWSGHHYDYGYSYPYYRYSRYDRFGGYGGYSYPFTTPVYNVVVRDDSPKGRWVKGRGYVRNPDTSTGSSGWVSRDSNSSSGSSTSSSSSSTGRKATRRGGGGGGGM